MPVGRVVMSDVTEYKRAEDKLRLAASVFTHAHEGIMITATDGTISDVNDAFSQITGYSRDEVMGRNPRMLSSGRQEPAFYAAMWRDLLNMVTGTVKCGDSARTQRAVRRVAGYQHSV